MKKQYRIVRDGFLGYEVQYKPWFWPFWVQAGITNTHETLEDAEDFARRHASGWSRRESGGSRVVRELGELP